jgi:hypothetical protein
MIALTRKTGAKGRLAAAAPTFRFQGQSEENLDSFIPTPPSTLSSEIHKTSRLCCTHLAWQEQYRLSLTPVQLTCKYINSSSDHSPPVADTES